MEQQSSLLVLFFLVQLVTVKESFGWLFTTNPSTATIDEGGSVPMHTLIAQITSPAPPAPGSVTTDAFQCLFAGTMSFPANSYKKFTLSPDYFQYSNFASSYCQLVQIAPISCSTDVSATNQIVLSIQMADLTQNFYTVGYSAVMNYVINVNCLTSTSSTTSTTGAVPTSTFTPWVKTPAGIAVLTVCCVIGAALLATAIFLLVRFCKQRPDSTEKTQLADDEAANSSRTRSNAADWTSTNYYSSRS